jgi:DNA-binding transcriptional LysR family regulator
MEGNLKKYEAFVKTAETGSFSEAAKGLHYAQSSVSKMVGDLEAMWQLRLLERGRKGVRLTASGEALLPKVRQILQDERRLQETVDHIRGLEGGRVCVGVFSSVATFWLPDIMADFQKKYPRIDIELFMGDYEEIEAGVRQGRADFGIVGLPAGQNLESELLTRDEYVAVLPEGHSLCGKEKIAPSDFNDQPFLLLEHGGKTEVSQILSNYGIRPDIRLTTWEDYAIMAMVEKGLGTAILPKLILGRCPYRIAVRPLDPPYYRDIGLVFRDRAALSPAAAKLAGSIRHWVQTC